MSEQSKFQRALDKRKQRHRKKYAHIKPGAIGEECRKASMIWHWQLFGGDIKVCDKPSQSCQKKL